MKLILPNGTVTEGSPEEVAQLMRAMNGERCECPRVWFGVLPPPCPVHNPPRPSITRSSTIGMYSEDVLCD